MKLTEQQKEIALEKWREVSASTSVGESIALKFAARFLAALPKPEKGPWTVGRNEIDARVYLQSEDFEHDARLYVNGDFGGDAMEYAVRLAIWMNENLSPPQPDDVRDAWQPIETAPRNSRRVLVASMSVSGEWMVREAWWRLPYECAPVERCWWCYDGDKTMLDSSVHGCGATHWMPLPEAPAIAAAKGEK